MLFRFIALISPIVAAGSSIRAAGDRELQGQPSAKFAASWSEDPVVAGECLNNDNQDMLDFWGSSSMIKFDWCDKVDSTNESTLVLSQVANLGRIKIPNDKEMLITLSSQIDILTVTTATSEKKGGKPPRDLEEQDYYGNIGATSAMAGVQVELFAQSEGNKPVKCHPGKVTMASRYIELRNLIGGEVTYEDCIDEIQANCEIKVADTDLSSTVGLAMDTAAAHSFQWVCANLDSAAYDVYAHFSLESDTANLCDTAFGGDCGTNYDLAAARVMLGKRMLTVQQVRAVKGALEF